MVIVDKRVLKKPGYKMVTFFRTNKQTNKQPNYAKANKQKYLILKKSEIQPIVILYYMGLDNSGQRRY